MKNIVLIGMPSSGKSTVGKELALRLGMQFTDTDTLIYEKVKKPLREIVREDGLAKFLEIQENIILDLNLSDHVIATGGSVIYGTASMQHLKSSGRIVYLKTGLGEIEQRITAGRRFARNDGQTLTDLYNERVPLYEKYADTTIECIGRPVEEIASEIEEKVKGMECY